MSLLSWLTQYTNRFPQLFNHNTNLTDANTSISTRTSALEKPSETSSIPTLSFDLKARTDSPSGSGWTVEKVWSTSDVDSDDFAQKFQDILNRTESYSILNDLFYRYITGVLVVVWSVVLWRKLMRSADIGFGWVDGLAVVAFVGSVFWRDIAIAIGVTAAYAAWAVLADRPWNGKGGLPGFETFVKGLKKTGTGNGDAQGSQEQAAHPQAVAPSAEPGSEAEAALLTRLEANLGLPEKKPEEECVVCWASSDEEPPLKLPCSHLVCKGCLTRLKDANRYTCPFCRVPLYTLSTTKITLFQLIAASSGAQLALALVLTALRVTRRQYWGAAESLFFKGYPSAVALWGQWGIRKQGEEGYFASTSENSLKLQLGFSAYLVHTLYGGMNDVGWATFIDGKWIRANVDEGQFLRNVACWALPGVAGKVFDCR